MAKPRPCGCKGYRTCLVCEKEYGADKLKLQLTLDKSNGYVYCPFCNKAWSGWDMDLYKQHPNHEGHSIEYPGVYIDMDFLSVDDEKKLMEDLDEIPWDISQSGRRKQNFGPKTNFKKRRIVPGNFDGFPESTKFIQDRFKTIPLLENYDTIEQCSLEYDPSKGASIDPHIDDCWIWGERIITVNCLSDTVLTMVPYNGGITKYNLQDAKEYCLTVLKNNVINKECVNVGVNALEMSEPTCKPNVIIRIPMPRYSLAVLYGEPRYHWEHLILREDITSRRVCIAYREFTPPYWKNGLYHDIGDVIREKGKNFWDHKVKYGINE